MSVNENLILKERLENENKLIHVAINDLMERESQQMQMHGRQISPYVYEQLLETNINYLKQMKVNGNNK